MTRRLTGLAVRDRHHGRLGNGRRQDEQDGQDDEDDPGGSGVGLASGLKEDGGPAARDATVPEG